MTAVRLKHHEPAGVLALLASRRFGPLFTAQFLSAFNDNAVKNALVLMIAYRGDATSQMSAQILIPLAGGLFILPFFLCSATAGQLADQHDKAWLIRLIKLSEVALMLAAAAGVVAGSTTALLAVLCVMGIEAAFFGPLKYAILPDLLAPHELILGNALIEGGTFIAILLGTIAGVLIAGHHGAGLIRKALKYIPPERLVITTDCGFGRVGLSRRIAYYKCVSLVQGTNIVRRELGLPEAHIRAAYPRLYFAGAGEG